jgi:NAD(P)-dependent dehydrogenase (short-subunit alcohol dehydrogenase family)
MTTYSLPYFTADLTGQTALITGASSGLGRRFALTLASSGAKVALAARRLDRLTDLRDEIELLGGHATVVALDMTDSGSIITAVEEVQREFGTVSILVNNAGVPDAQLAHKMPIALIDRVLNTNLRGPFIIACEVARRLIDSGQSGRIVNIASMGAFQYSIRGASMYSISKAAVVRMTEVLAVEWAQFGINVNAIAPGIFSSEMIDGMISRIGDMTDSLPRKRIGHPAQLDSTLLYLVSPSSEFVTGTIIKVDDAQSGR